MYLLDSVLCDLKAHHVLQPQAGLGLGVPSDVEGALSDNLRCKHSTGSSSSTFCSTQRRSFLIRGRHLSSLNLPAATQSSSAWTSCAHAYAGSHCCSVGPLLIHRAKALLTGKLLGKSQLKTYRRILVVMRPKWDRVGYACELFAGQPLCSASCVTKQDHHDNVMVRPYWLSV